MLPREHGAYGQLLLPLVTAMAMGRPTAAALAIGIAAAAAFVAHEPLLVLLGRRGGRARREQRNDAVRWLSASVGVAAIAGAAALLLLDAAGRSLTLVPAACAAAAAIAVLRGRERSTGGEIVVSTALASVSLPVAVASGASMAAASTCAATFAVAFAAATVSVRAVIAGARGSAGGERRIALATDAGLLTIVAALALARVILPAALWAAAPVCAVAIALAVVIPPPRYLRRIGWTLVAATALTGGILIVTIR
jgi:YwiC-like protein